MKAKLILKHRGDYNYFLVSRTDNSEALVASLNPDEEIFEQKLSKQNCDEIFGVVDVEKLAKEDADLRFPNQGDEESWLARNSGVVWGFNKAMELNKDKVFTINEVKKLMLEIAKKSREEKDLTLPDYVNNILNNIDYILEHKNKVNEIRVEIETEKIYYPANMPKEGEERPEYRPKLDSNGCLILKKI
jgi:hypothetical protein